MKMQTIIAFACFGLLISVESAGAQHAGARKEYSLKVSVHKEVRPRLTKEHVEEILEGASELLNHCNVAFKLNGPIKTFDNTPAIIRTSAHRDAVHEVEADVKVVVDIKSCRSNLGVDLFNGCAFPRSMGLKSMIVTHARAATVPLRSILWAHEFGHRTGLNHRPAPDALMTGCSNLFGDQVEVKQDECHCFRLGPGGCERPDHGANVCSSR